MTIKISDRYVLRGFVENYLLAYKNGGFSIDEAVGDIEKAFALMPKKGWSAAIEYMRSMNKKHFDPEEAYKAHMAALKYSFLAGAELGSPKTKP
jgi:hypothetical protein